MRTIFRAVAWLLAFLIVILSLAPPSYRPVTGAGSNPEHIIIYFTTGLAFGLGYVNRWWVLFTGLVAFAAAVEFAQLVVPGRHARMSDFVIDAATACIGIALSWIGTRIFKSNQ